MITFSLHDASSPYVYRTSHTYHCPNDVGTGRLGAKLFQTLVEGETRVGDIMRPLRCLAADDLLELWYRNQCMYVIFRGALACLIHFVSSSIRKHAAFRLFFNVPHGATSMRKPSHDLRRL